MTELFFHDNFTIIMSVRIDSLDRELNLYSTLKYYSVISTVKIIIVESDTYQRISTSKLNSISDRIQHIFIKDDSPILHRTKYMNVGFRNVVTEYAANVDSDIVVPYVQLLSALCIAKEQNHSMVLPYDGKCIMLSAESTLLFRESSALDYNSAINTDLMFGKWSVGGAYIVNVRKYQMLGWENEFITAWGPEDAERFARMEIVGAPPVFVPGYIYHLNHKRGINSTYPNDALAFIAKKEYCRICSMLPDELRQYIQQWNWIK